MRIGISMKCYLCGDDGFETCKSAYNNILFTGRWGGREGRGKEEERGREGEGKGRREGRGEGRNGLPAWQQGSQSELQVGRKHQLLSW